MAHLWVAFSPATGETTLLNDESASILEVLELSSLGTGEIARVLAADSGLSPDSLVQIVDASWPRLIEAGLVRSRYVSDDIDQ
jgi:PqqD family protein of HPr-rel-A system